MNQKGLTQILTLGLITAILLAGISFAYVRFFRNTNESSNVNELVNTNISLSNANVNANTNSNTNTALIVNTNISLANTNTVANTNTSVELTGSETTSVDDTWNRYTNHDFGFYLNIPKQAWFYSGSCYYNTDGDDHSYRPREAIVPVVAFEESDSVYVAQEYYYDLAGETREGSRAFFSECSQVYSTFELLDMEQRTWHFITATVTNDIDLNNFINENYGTGGCTLGEQTESKFQAGVYNVTVQTDGLDPPDSNCWMNYATVIKYYPAGNKVVAWDLGQSYHFWAIALSEYVDESTYHVYDQDMEDSFRFIE